MKLLITEVYLLLLGKEVNHQHTTSGDYYYFDKTYNYSDFTVNSTNSDTVSVVVADAAGNVTNKSKTITISTVDNVSPTISGFTSNKTNNVVELLTSAK